MNLHKYYKTFHDSSPSVATVAVVPGSIVVVVDSPPSVTLWYIFCIQCNAYDQVSNYLDKTTHFSCTRKNFFKQIFGFQIVLYGDCDGGSCKKNQKSQCFVHFLNVLMVREWIYVDVDRPRFQENIHTIGSTDHQVQLLNGFAIFHKAQHTQGLWKIAKKPNPLVKFGCEIGSVKL